MQRRNFLKTTSAFACLAPSLLSAQSSAEQPQATSDPLNPAGVNLAGIRMVPVAGGKYKVWTKRMGSGPVKVLLLHGGPGFPHDYLEAMEAFLPPAGIEMYYYDQLGVGNSDVPEDPSLWTLERYTQEVEEVRRGLGLDQFVLYGHSWGGILALEYALNFQQHLRGLVISDMTAGMKSYLAYTSQLKAKLLTPEKLAHFNALEAAKDYDNPDYERICMEDLYPRMLCRLNPWPEPAARAFNHANQKIYNQMQGKSEFEVTGSLKDWERWDRLQEIRVRTLTMGARYDEMDPEDMVKMAKLMPNATSAICPNGSHLCMWDDQAIYFRHLLSFLHSIQG
jgi:proline iminopeptidase